MDALHQAQLATKFASLAALIFPSETGGPVFPENLRAQVWKPALQAASVRHVKIHSLRHFYASMLIAQGESILYVSRQLGHSSVKITADIYGHLFPDERRAAAGTPGNTTEYRGRREPAFCREIVKALAKK